MAKKMQWYPLFVDLLCPLVEGHYELRTAQSVGELPRAADVVLLRRTAVGPLPFVGLWRHLTAWNLLEYKGPTVSARLSDLPDLVELGLGISRRLNELQRKEEKPEQDSPEVSFWYLANDLGSRYLAALPDHLPGLQQLSAGVWRAELLRHPVFLVSVQDVPVERDTLPLHVLAGVAEKDRPTVTDLLRSDRQLWPRYGAWLAVNRPDIWEEIQRMSAEQAEAGTLDYQPLIDYMRQTGDVKRFVEAYGVKQAIEAVGVKQVVEAIGIKRVWEQLSEQERAELLRLAQADQATSPGPGAPQPPG